jgi:hypothetical protein
MLLRISRAPSAGSIEPCLPSTARASAPGHRAALRVVTRNQLARALRAPTSPILIWNSSLAVRFERLLWVQERQWRLFGTLLDVLTDDISREYGVNFGQDWSVGRHTTGEIVLTLERSPR